MFEANIECLRCLRWRERGHDKSRGYIIWDTSFKVNDMIFGWLNWFHRHGSLYKIIVQFGRFFGSSSFLEKNVSIVMIRSLEESMVFSTICFDNRFKVSLQCNVLHFASLQSAVFFANWISRFRNLFNPFTSFCYPYQLIISRIAKSLNSFLYHPSVSALSLSITRSIL